MISTVSKFVAVAVLVMLAEYPGIAAADMGEVRVQNLQDNDTTVWVVPGPLCSYQKRHDAVPIHIGETVALDCDAVLKQDRRPVTMFLIESDDDRTLVCSVRWDDAGIFTVEAGLACRTGEIREADITVFEP